MVGRAASREGRGSQMSIKTKCQHGRHETIAEARACMTQQPQTSPAEKPGWAARLERAHTSNPRTSERTRRAVLGTWTPDQEADGAAAAEMAYERHLEDRGANEARAQDDHEARNGVISFQDAWDMACPERVQEREEERRQVEAEALRRVLQHREHVRTAVTEDGMYKIADGTIFKVQRAVHGSGHLYAKRLVVDSEAVRDAVGNVVTPAEVHFEYAPGAIRNLTAQDRLTLEEAKKFGALYGTCCVCGRTLTRESSIAAGIGPVCAGRL